MIKLQAKSNQKILTNMNMCLGALLSTAESH